MSILKLCIASAAQQFITFAAKELLSDRAKNLMSTVTLSLAAAAVVLPTAAQAQVWAGQSASSGGSVLPQGSAGRWGDLLGGTLGRVLAASVGGSSNTELGRRVQDVVSGVSEEVGRNVGRKAAESPYQSQSEQTVRGRSADFARLTGEPYYAPVAQESVWNESKPRPGRLLPAQSPLIFQHQDHLDLLALKAVVANDDLMRARMPPVSRTSVLDNANVFALTSFELALRSEQQQGLDVQPWMAVRSALLRPIGTVSQEEFVALSSPMIDRITRPGGPGASAIDSSSVNQVSDMRTLNVLRQQAGVRSMPIENFGR